MGFTKSGLHLLSRHRKGGAFFLLGIIGECDQEDGGALRQGKEMLAIAIAQGRRQRDQSCPVIDPGWRFELAGACREEVAFDDSYTRPFKDPMEAILRDCGSDTGLQPERLNRQRAEFDPGYRMSEFPEIEKITGFSTQRNEHRASMRMAKAGPIAAECGVDVAQMESDLALIPPLDPEGRFHGLRGRSDFRQKHRPDGRAQ